MEKLERPRKDPRVILVATLFTGLLLALGFLSFGPWTAFIFSFGFLGGLFLWLIFPTNTPFANFKKQYWLTLFAFIFFHRVEENVFGFQDELAKITGHPVPDILSPSLIFLVLASVGGWVFAPYLIKRNNQLGYYLAWSFFASMGITELAHFVFPLLVAGPYVYFPGMISVFALAPIAWWGMYRLADRASPNDLKW